MEERTFERMEDEFICLYPTLAPLQLRESFQRWVSNELQSKSEKMVRCVKYCEKYVGAN